MRIGIDASNLRAGGGVTHLVELLRATDPHAHGFEKVIVWGGAVTLSKIEDRDWLCKVHDPLLDGGLLFRQYWQRFKVAKLARDADCNILFAPGGSYAGNFRPFVTMSRNMLPFEWDEARRYGMSWQLLRIALLRRSQSQTFRKADGLIFLTEYARDGVMKVVKCIGGASAIIPHGIDARFVHPCRAQRDIGQYSGQRPFRILYVSVVEVYKHQWHVAEAVSQLWKAGLPVRLDLVGPAFPPALKRLKGSLDRLKAADSLIHYHGPISHADLPRWYRDADLFVFASSCENMPNILLEGMASGLPIACSSRGPMPEILGDAGVYFDPEKPQEIASAIKFLIDSPSLRDEKAKVAHRYVADFSWQRCADETFRFLAQVVLSATDGRHVRLFQERTG
jgi:glycosyltransferase involved in cell wall biosynthesis